MLRRYPATLAPLRTCARWGHAVVIKHPHGFRQNTEPHVVYRHLARLPISPCRVLSLREFVVESPGVNATGTCIPASSPGSDGHIRRERRVDLSK